MCMRNQQPKQIKVEIFQSTNMRGLPKSKRVSWATDGNLRQVRMFLSEDSPSQVGIGIQDHMQLKKKAVFLYNTGSVAMSGNVLPPGFEGANPENQLLKNKLTHITLPTWKCPPRFLMDPLWRVTSSEESDEIEIENQRELRVLEAIYPRPSDIPPNSAVSLDVESIVCDDSRTSLVPINSIEEEDVCEEVSKVSSFSAASCPPGFANDMQPSSVFGSASFQNPFKKGGSEVCVQAQPQLLAAASAAVSALLTGGGEPGRLIDQGLLLKILSSPAIFEEFKKRQGNLSGGQDMSLLPESSQVAPNQPAPIVPTYNLPLPHFSQVGSPNVPSSSTTTPKGPFYPPQPNANPTVAVQHPPPTTPSSSTSHLSLVHAGAPPPKDLNYYKSLIQQHGGDRQQEVTPLPSSSPNHGGSGPSPDPVVNARLNMDSTPRFTKPCLYFNSPAGCRNGANCPFQHGCSLQQRVSSIPEMQSSKRMKTGRDMRGSQPYS